MKVRGLGHRGPVSQVREAVHDVAWNQGLLDRAITSGDERVQPYKFVIPLNAPPATVALLGFKLATGTPVPDNSRYLKFSDF